MTLYRHDVPLIVAMVTMLSSLVSAGGKKVDEERLNMTRICVKYPSLYTYIHIHIYGERETYIIYKYVYIYIYRYIKREKSKRDHDLYFFFML